MTLAPRPAVLLLGPMYHPAGQELLARHVDLHILAAPPAEALREAIREAAAVWVRYPTRLTADAVRAGRRLLVISTSGRGTDAVDIPAATAAGVAVVNNPGLGRRPVTEHTIALMLDLAKQITRSDAATRRGEGWAAPNRLPRIELEGLALGLIGLGDIGREVARTCAAAFRMRVLAYDPYVPPSAAAAAGAVWVGELARLLADSDIVSIHAELTDETRGMIGERELRLMRPGAFLINTARGPIVQQAALLRALGEGWIRGAALDVFDPEPPPQDSPLYREDRLILTPHLAGMTEQAAHQLALSAAGQILQVLRGEQPPHLVNPEVWAQVRDRARAAAGPV
jgi:phosphoglycerate dehydrogenase-like enzyme